MEIGVDCVEISRFQDILFNLKMQKRIFTQNEINYCLNNKSPCKHFAARFAGKEAIVKALSQKDIQVTLNKIEILNDQIGRPHVKILDEKYSDIVIKISLSHSDTIAMAFAVIV